MPKTDITYTPEDIDLDSEEAKVYLSLNSAAMLLLLLTPRKEMTEEQKVHNRKLTVAAMKTTVEGMGYTLTKKELPSIFGES